MPLIRIDLQKGKTADYRKKVGQVIYDAMIATVAMPKNDRFQLIMEHDPDNFIYDSDYLGVHRTNDLIMITITFNDNRTTDQKKALYKTIADSLHEAVGLRREDALVVLVEVKKENWSFGNGVAQYAA